MDTYLGKLLSKKDQVCIKKIWIIYKADENENALSMYIRVANVVADHDDLLTQ